MQADNIETINTNDCYVEDSETSAKLHDIITNIEILTSDFLATKGDDVKTLKDLSQREYCAFLMYVRDNYIRPTKCIYKFFPGINNNKQITLLIDDDILCGIVDYYISLSLNADKVCNKMGLNALLGIAFDTIDRLEKAKDQRPEASAIIKTLDKWYEYSLEVGAQTGKNPVGYMATLNHRFKWSDDSKPQIQVNITRDKSQIMSSVNPELIGKNE